MITAPEKIEQVAQALKDSQSAAQAVLSSQKLVSEVSKEKRRMISKLRTVQKQEAIRLSRIPQKPSWIGSLLTDQEVARQEAMSEHARLRLSSERMQSTLKCLESEEAAARDLTALNQSFSSPMLHLKVICI